jgi:hypothetical protein
MLVYPHFGAPHTANGCGTVPSFTLLHRCCTRAPSAVRKHIFSLSFSCKSLFFKVEPRGFEPLTSAMQSQIPNVAAVRWCSEYLQINGFLSDPLRACSPLFVWVGVLLVYRKCRLLSSSSTSTQPSEDSPGLLAGLLHDCCIDSSANEARQQFISTLIEASTSIS